MPAVGEADEQGRRFEVVSHFAPARRASAELLSEQIRAAGSHPITEAVLHAFGGVVVVLNAQRQAIAANHALLTLLGIEDMTAALGLRPGEILECVHSHDCEGGCGTSQFCSTCGAVLAILASQAREEAVERECLMTRVVQGREESIEFRVRATPLKIEEQMYTVVTLQDIRAEKRRECLQRVFFHDLMNLMTGLQTSCDLYFTADATGQKDLTRQIQLLSRRLVEETTTQRDLFLMEANQYNTSFTETELKDIFQQIGSVFGVHESSRQKVFDIASENGEARVITDPILLVRVLINMVKNAFEATPEGGTVRIWCEPEPETVAFKVWNAAHMPEEIALRVFQRYFTTKRGTGRGLGTYSMKFMGERYLGGSVDFVTSSEGTVFTLRIPSRPSQ